MIDKIEEKLKVKGESWKSYSDKIGQDSSNFKRKLSQNISRLNSWLELLGVELTIQEREEKKEDKTLTDEAG